MPTLVRAAARPELQTIQTIERASAQRFLGVMDAVANDEPSPLPLLDARREAGGLLVAEFQAGGASALAGFVIFRPLEESLYVEQIDVLPDFGRQRIGATLIDAVADQARNMGLARLTLSTFRDIPWNAPYYRKLGFADLDGQALSPGLAAVRYDHLARGLDENARVFMARKL
jgi:GNAT superfamily N-acetyltransferase